MAAPSTITPMPLPFWRFFDRLGTTPLSGGKLWTYVPGSVTPLTVFKDYAQTQAWPNPIVLTAASFPGGAGYVPGLVYPPVSTAVKYVLQDADGVELWSADTIPSSVGVDMAANTWLGFTPSWLNTGTPNQIGNGGLAGAYRLIGPATVEFGILLWWGSTTVSGNGGWAFGNLPFPVKQRKVFQVAVFTVPYGATNAQAVFNAAPATTVLTAFRPQINGLIGVNFAAFGATVPLKWTVGNFMSITGDYEFGP